MHILSATETGYLAGIVDGEGSIALNPTSGFRKPTVCVANNDLPLLEYLCRTVGSGRINFKPARKVTHSDSYQLVWASDTAIDICVAIWFELRIPKKRARAKLLADEYKTLSKRNGWYTDSERAAKQDFEHRFFALTA